MKKINKTFLFNVFYIKFEIYLNLSICKYSENLFLNKNIIKKKNINIFFYKNNFLKKQLKFNKYINFIKNDLLFIFFFDFMNYILIFKNINYDYNFYNLVFLNKKNIIYKKCLFNLTDRNNIYIKFIFFIKIIFIYFIKILKNLTF